MGGAGWGRVPAVAAERRMPGCDACTQVPDVRVVPPRRQVREEGKMHLPDSNEGGLAYTLHITGSGSPKWTFRFRRGHRHEDSHTVCFRVPSGERTVRAGISRHL